MFDTRIRAANQHVGRAKTLQPRAIFGFDGQDTTTAIRCTTFLPSSHSGPGSIIDASRLLKVACADSEFSRAICRPQTLQPLSSRKSGIELSTDAREAHEDATVHGLTLRFTLHDTSSKSRLKCIRTLNPHQPADLLPGLHKCLLTHLLSPSFLSVLQQSVVCRRL